MAQRYRCVRCGRTFRVYPVWVTHDQTSTRLKGVAVMFYVLGMSYGAVATALSALGWPFSKVAVYYAVQEAGGGGDGAAAGGSGPWGRAYRGAGRGSDHGPVCGAVAERRHRA